MIQHRYSVIQETTQSEVSWHYSEDKAVAMADRYAAKDGGVYRVDLNVVEVTREGAECIDANPDLYATAPRDPWGV